MPRPAQLCYRPHPDAMGILRLLHEAFAISTCSLNGLAQRSGVPVTTLWRHLQRPYQVQVEAVERLLVVLGCALSCQDALGHWYGVPLSAKGVVSCGGNSAEPALPAASLCACIAQEQRRCGVSLRTLERASGLPYATVRRYVTKPSQPLLEQLVLILGCLGYALHVLTSAGDQVAIPVPEAHSTIGDERHRAHLHSVDHYRERHVLCVPRRAHRGRLEMDEAEVVQRYERDGQRYAQIAAHAGISSDRVRQILKSHGVLLERDRRLVQRRGSAQLLVLSPGA